MIRAIIFDCFGVLYRDNTSILYDIIPDNKQSELQDIIHASDHGAISRDEYYHMVAELSSKTIDEVQQISARQFSRNEALVEEILPLKKQYKIGLLSNVGEDVMDHLFPQSERATLFDSFVLSSQIGLIKPSREIFEYAAADLGFLPEECMMIDDIPRNIEGAQAVGMQGIVYSNNRQIMSELYEMVAASNA